MKQYKKRNTRGFSHHFLLPVIVVIAVAGIGGYVMLQSSSAATTTKSCTSVTFGRYKNNPVYSKYKHYKPCVQAIQKKVGAKADGIYGDYTQSRVKAWQKSHKLTADGVVGSKTWKAMGLNTKYTVKTAPKKDTTTGMSQSECNRYKDKYVWNSSAKKCEKRDTMAGISRSECNRYKDKYFWNEKTNKCAKKEKQKVCLYSVKSYDPYVAKKAPSKPACSDEMVLPSKVKAYNDSNKKIDKQYKADLKKWESYRKAQNDRNIPRAV